MRFHVPENPKSEFRNPTSAFTLVEILIVVILIALLAGILMPSLLRARQLAYLANTRAYIAQLESGALRYQQENQYFPGQDDPTLLGGGGNPFTGSQILGVRLFGLDISGDEIVYQSGKTAPTSAYVEYQPERVANSDTGGDTDKYSFAPVDFFPGDAAAVILYYPSRLGNDGTFSGDSRAFEFSDNSTYTGTGTGVEDKFISAIRDTRFGTGNRAYNADTFLLFGKALDDRDSAESWFTDKSPRNF